MGGPAFRRPFKPSFPLLVWTLKTPRLDLELLKNGRYTLADMTVEEIERWSPLKVWFYALTNRNPKSNQVVVALANLSPADRFLDIGCGPGAALEEALKTGANVAGVDPSPAMVAKAKKRAAGADVKVGSAEDLPFPDGHFTVVINVLSFHHWADRETGLKEILRVLAPGGLLHVVEGKLRDEKDGHGLNPSDAQALADRLLELGYSDATVDEIKPGRRHRYFVVSGEAPGTLDRLDDQKSNRHQ